MWSIPLLDTVHKCIDWPAKEWLAQPLFMNYVFLDMLDSLAHVLPPYLRPYPTIRWLQQHTCNPFSIALSVHANSYSHFLDLFHNHDQFHMPEISAKVRERSRLARRLIHHAEEEGDHDLVKQAIQLGIFTRHHLGKLLGLAITGQSQFPFALCIFNHGPGLQKEDFLRTLAHCSWADSEHALDRAAACQFMECLSIFQLCPNEYLTQQSKWWTPRRLARFLLNSAIFSLDKRAYLLKLLDWLCEPRCTLPLIATKRRIVARLADDLIRAHGGSSALRTFSDSQFAVVFACRLLAQMHWKEGVSLVDLSSETGSWRVFKQEAQNRGMIGNGGFSQRLPAVFQEAIGLALPRGWIGRSSGYRMSFEVRFKDATGRRSWADLSDNYDDCLEACEVLAAVDVRLVLRFAKWSRFMARTLIMGVLRDSDLDLKPVLTSPRLVAGLVRKLCTSSKRDYVWTDVRRALDSILSGKKVDTQVLLSREVQAVVKEFGSILFPQ